MIIALIILTGIAVFLLIYKKSWFLKRHVHNVLGTLYEMIRKIKKEQTEYEMPMGVKHANATSPLTFKSYIHDTQNVHPKVLYFANEFGGHKFWMAYTPFPWYIDRYENPSIAFSDDGYFWTNIEGNPIDDPKGNGYDSDTHLVYREDLQVLECWYRHVGKYSIPPVEEVLYRRISKDGVHWSDDEIVYGNYSGKYAMLLSPAILWDGEKYSVWTINKENDFKIEFRIYMKAGEMEKVRDYDLSFEIDGDQTKYKPWHLDVIKDDEKYVMLVMCKEEKGSGPRRWDLFLSTSEDNEVYSKPEIVLHGTKNGWDNNIYRASIVNVEGEYRIYYSALNNMGKHGLGIARSDHLGDFEGLRENRWKD